MYVRHFFFVVGDGQLLWDAYRRGHPDACRRAASVGRLSKKEVLDPMRVE